MGSYQPAAETNQLIETLKRSAAALRDAEVPFALAGSVACWARGGPAPYNDVDFAVREEDGERGLQALVDAGMRPERPPEGWLLKAWDGDVLVDLIFAPVGLRVDDPLFDTADRMNVFSIHMPVMRLEDVFATKLMSLNDHYLDYAGLLKLVRAVREQVDWDEVRDRTRESPYARAFFALLDELDVVAGAQAGRPGVRVVQT
jgi:hypothetical protein